MCCWFGFAASLAGIIGALCLSALVDRPRFRRSLKSFMLICFIGCFVSVLCFQFCVRTVFSDKPLISSASILIGFSLSFAGLFQGASSPLVYETSAEIMFPLPESLSASILVQWNNIACVILLFVASQQYKLINLLVLIVIAVSILMVSFTRVTYKRQDEDSRKTAAIVVQSVELDSRVPE
ncbi:unnamed protein product [Adineta ricciae]|uniref:Uncharacterized protein n=1 Tax=Adineta ricciae TaxID=249248 RepID=A0A815LGL6_ADIRI|nr:unnamed protein product [Adineta ricciae]